MKVVSKEDAQRVAIDLVKKKKDTEIVDVALIEEKDDCWVIQGTCPIDLEGHPWTEKFEVIIDCKGKVRSTDFALL